MRAPNWRSMAAVDKAGYGLHPVALAEWHGLVWLNLAENPTPFDGQVWRQLDYRLGGDRAKFARYDLARLVAGRRVDYTVAANWKIIQENFQECYHCATIHPELVDALPQFRSLTGGVDATYETDGYHFAEDKASFSLSGETILPRLPGLEDRDDRRYFGMIIRPNCALSLLPDHGIVHRFEPVGPELTTVVCEWLFPPETVAAHDIGDAVELFHLVNQQDFAASEWCQPNMRSRAYANGGVLVPTEQEIIGRWYYRWYANPWGWETRCDRVRHPHRARRPRSGPAQRLGDHPDLPGVHFRAAARPAGGIRVGLLPHRQSHPRRPRRMSGRTGQRRLGGRGRFRYGGLHHRHPGAVPVRRAPCDAGQRSTAAPGTWYTTSTSGGAWPTPRWTCVTWTRWPPRSGRKPRWCGPRPPRTHC